MTNPIEFTGLWETAAFGHVRGFVPVELSAVWAVCC